VPAACLDLLLRLPLERGLGHLPSSGRAWWALGVCVMVKRVSEMSERKVSKSKCCLPPGSSSSSPSSMGTTLQKSWLHHFSVGLQTSSSCVRWSKGARWAPLMGRVRAWLPGCSTWQLPSPRSVYHSKAPHLARWCFQKGESECLASHPIGLVTPWGFHPPFSQAAQCRGLHCVPLFPPPHPSPADSPALGWRVLPPGWTFGAGRRTACVTRSQGRHDVGQSQQMVRGGQCS